MGFISHSALHLLRTRFHCVDGASAAAAVVASSLAIAVDFFPLSFDFETRGYYENSPRLLSLQSFNCINFYHRDQLKNHATLVSFLNDLLPFLVFNCFFYCNTMHIHQHRYCYCACGFVRSTAILFDFVRWLWDLFFAFLQAHNNAHTKSSCVNHVGRKRH